MFMLDKYMLAANVETCLIMLCFFASLKTYYWDMGWIQMWDQIWPTKLRTNFRRPSGWLHVWPHPWDPTGSGGGSILGYQNNPRKVGTKSCIPTVRFTFMKSTCWIRLQKNIVLWHNVACTTGWEACFLQRKLVCLMNGWAQQLQQLQITDPMKWLEPWTTILWMHGWTHLQMYALMSTYINTCVFIDAHHRHSHRHKFWFGLNIISNVDIHANMQRCKKTCGDPQMHLRS